MTHGVMRGIFVFLVANTVNAMDLSMWADVSERLQ